MSFGSLFRGITRVAAPIVGGMFGGPMGAMAGNAIGGLIGGGGARGGNPADAAQAYTNQIPSTTLQYLQPQMERMNAERAQDRATSAEAYNRLLNQYNRGTTQEWRNDAFPLQYGEMARMPASVMNSIMQTYSPSTGYQYKQNQMLGAARNSAASGGFAGTTSDQAQQAELVKDLLGSDMGEYFNNILNIMTQGAAGEERRLGGRERAFTHAMGLQSPGGEAVSSDISNILGSNLGQQASYRFQQQRQENLDRARRQQERSELFGTLVNPLTNAMSGSGGFLRGLF